MLSQHSSALSQLSPQSASNVTVPSQAFNNRPEQEQTNSKKQKGEDSHYKGGVTVRFEFRDPVRTKRNLIVPAYTTDTGGQVVVAVTLNNGGEVIAARVKSGGTEIMREEALKAL